MDSIVIFLRTGVYNFHVTLCTHAPAHAGATPGRSTDDKGVGKTFKSLNQS
jgi:hypothetical protein